MKNNIDSNYEIKIEPFTIKVRKTTKVRKYLFGFIPLGFKFIPGGYEKHIIDRRSMLPMVYICKCHNKLFGPEGLDL